MIENDRVPGSQVKRYLRLQLSGIKRRKIIQEYQKYDKYGNIVIEKSLRQSWSCLH
jgi:hypothetical protein